MTNTFDTSRVGGGTYELEQDSNGNYKLKSVGFNQVNKLNLPDLATSDATKPPVATIPKQPKIDDPFKKLALQNTGGGEGGGQDYSAVAPREAKVKEASVSELGQKTNTTYNAMTDAEKNAIATGTATVSRQKGPQVYNEAMSFQGTPTTKQVGPQVIDTTKTYTTPRTIADQNKFYGRSFTDKTTGLQKVTSAISNTVNKIMNNNVTVAVIKGISNTITSPEQRANNSANTTALRSNGYQTDFQGKVVGRDGKAVSAADSVFGGMNSRSAFGDISKGAQSRIDTRTSTKTQERMSTKSKEKQDAFNQKTRDMQRELANHNNAKNTDKEKSKSKGTNTNPNMRAGADNDGPSGRVICTDLHRTGELSTKDWIRDTKFTFTTLSKKHVKGYLLWAEPTVKHMQKYPRYRKMWKHIAQHRANDITWRLNEGKFDLLGRIYAGIGEPVCWALGNFVSDKQISKYNLTHWRRA